MTATRRTRTLVAPWPGLGRAARARGAADLPDPKPSSTFLALAAEPPQSPGVSLQNEFVEFKPSSIDGTGGFARCDLPAGARVIEYVGERIDKRESRARCERGEHFIFHLDDQWDLDGNVDRNPARLLNHSCAPNCDAEFIDGRIWIVTTRPVARGEEITFNYGYDLEDYRDYVCRCGAESCVGFIVAEEFFSGLRAGRPGS